MTNAESIRTLADEVRQLILENITLDGECLFDSTKARLALEFVKQEIEKSIRQKRRETD